MPSTDEYAVLLERLRAHGLAAEVVADIEAYREYWQRSAYEIGCVNAQMVLGVPVDEFFTTTPFNPFAEA